MLTFLIPLLLLLVLFVVGSEQAKARAADHPALLRFEAWQLGGLLLVPLMVVSHGAFPVLAAVLVFVLGLLAAFLVRRRRRVVDDVDF